MRFPADDIWKVRAGEKTVIHIPVGIVNPEHEAWIADARAPFKPSEFYAVERVVMERRSDPCPNIDDPPSYMEIHGEMCRRCKGHDEVNVRYVGVPTALDGEYVEVLAVSRRRPAQVTDADALLEGYESREEWLDVFDAEHEGTDEVWRIEFRYADDVPNLLAKHSDYTHTLYDAVSDEPEAVDRRTLERFTRDAHNRDELRTELKREERKLSEWLAELENDPATSAHQLASVRKRLEQIDKRRRRKAA